MNIYYIYSFDEPGIDDILNGFTDKLKNLNFRPFSFNESERCFFWKFKAYRKIRESDVVVFFMGDHFFEHSKNVEYELKIADHFSKKVYCVPVNDCQMTYVRKDKFSHRMYQQYQIISAEDLIKLINSNMQDYNLSDLVFKDRNTDAYQVQDKEILLEQYREMIISTEALMTRRQNTSSFYISINTAMVSIMGLIGAFGVSKDVLFLIMCVLSLFGMVICYSWRGALNSYDKVNESKYNVLECMEDLLPASMFYAEYRETKNFFRSRVFPSYSEREKTIPTIFMMIYAIMLFAGICMLMGSLISG